MSICSIHRTADPNCQMCNAMPWDLFKITKEQWEAKSLYAKSEGEIICPNCDFKMYKKTCRQPDDRYLCPCCSKYFNLDNQ